MGDEVLPWAAGGFIPGALIAGYRLEEQIGRGGMAVVFRAHDERLNRLVALKILAPALAADTGFRHRFIRESQAAAAVDDPNIIPVYEAGESDGVLFIAMRLVRGGDIKSRVATGGPLPVEQAMWIVSAMASALDAAHAAGLVHRDVKPANMLLELRRDRPFHVYLSDFGLSKAAVATSGLTGSGQFLGTVDYSAPEQIQGRTVDGRTDQYALGCAAFEFLAGEPPFPRDHGMATLLAHLTEVPPSISARREGLPPSADHVFTKVLAKKPEDRYSTCQEFADALGLVLAAHSVGSDQREPGRTRERVLPKSAVSGREPADRAVGAGKHSQPEPETRTPVATSVPPAERDLAGASAEGLAIAAVQAFPADEAQPRKRYVAALSAESMPTQTGQEAGLDAIALLERSKPDSTDYSEPPIDAVTELAHMSSYLSVADTAGPGVPPNDISDPGAGRLHAESDTVVTVPSEPDLPFDDIRTDRRKNLRKALIVSLSVVAVAGAATGVLLTRAPTGKFPATMASEAFPAQRFPDGVTAARRWTLTGHAGSMLTEMITLSNPTGTAQLVSFNEPIPAAIAPMLILADFSPRMVQYQSGARVAQWKISVPAHSRVVVGYRVKVPAAGATHARLSSWATNLAALAVPTVNIRPVLVSSLRISPHHLRLTVGSTAKLKISGRLKNGKTASAGDLASVVWSSSSPAVASVNRFGKVVADSVGKTHVTARLGVASAAIWVAVANLPTPNPGTGPPPVTNGPPPPPPTSNPPPTTHTTNPGPTSSASCPPYCTLAASNAQQRDQSSFRPSPIPSGWFLASCQRSDPVPMPQIWRSGPEWPECLVRKIARYTTTVAPERPYFWYFSMLQSSA